MSGRGQSVLDATCLLLLPIALVTCAILRLQASALLTLLTAVVSLLIFFLGWERSRPGLRHIVPTAVMAAAAVVGRVIFAAAPSFQPVTAICIIAGAAFGKRTGFMTGAMAALASSFFLGLGAWTPWQMYAWGLVGYVAGLFFGQAWQQKRSIILVLAYGFAASFAFGFIMNTWMLIGFAGPLNWGSALSVYGAGAIFDIAHALSTTAFLGLLYAPLRKKLDRIALKYDVRDVNEHKVES